MNTRTILIDLFLSFVLFPLIMIFPYLLGISKFYDFNGTYFETIKSVLHESVFPYSSILFFLLVLSPYEILLTIIGKRTDPIPYFIKFLVFLAVLFVLYLIAALMVNIIPYSIEKAAEILLKMVMLSLVTTSAHHFISREKSKA